MSTDIYCFNKQYLVNVQYFNRRPKARPAVMLANSKNIYYCKFPHGNYSPDIPFPGENAMMRDQFPDVRAGAPLT
jgi:hypothetical protein